MRSRLLRLAQNPATIDAALVVALAAASAVVGWSSFVHPTFLKSPKVELLYRPGWWQGPPWWWAATGVELGALFARRRYPVAAFAAVWGAAVFHSHTAWPLLPADAAALVALYSVAAYGRRLVSVAALLVALALLDLRTAIPFTFFGWTGGIALFGMLLLASWFSGAYVGQMRQRASTLERERDEQAELAARAERERITRELHDVVAHGLSVMVVQAQGASAALVPDRRKRSRPWTRSWPPGASRWPRCAGSSASPGPRGTLVLPSPPSPGWPSFPS